MPTLDEQIRQATEPFAPQLEQLQSIPGIKAITARDIIAEIGADMRRFGSATRLSSWAGVSPGNNESAGKRRKGRTRQGQSVSASGLGAMCLGGAEDANVYRADVSALEKVVWGGRKRPWQWPIKSW